MKERESSAANAFRFYYTPTLGSKPYNGYSEKAAITAAPLALAHYLPCCLNSGPAQVLSETRFPNQPPNSTERYYGSR
jgi:hypothetical protein